MPMAAGADEDMHRMQMCVGWIYEFCSRHRLEEAREALIRSAEKRFHISTNTLHEHTDPASLMQRLLDMGEFEKAYFEFETQLEDFKPLVGEELYTDTLHQIMVQVALQNLRGRVGAVSVELVDDLKERTRRIFPDTGGTKQNACMKLRAELLATTRKDADRILEKYSLLSFKERTAPFWRALRLVQKPTKLERVLQEIEEGKIKWDDLDAEDDAPVLPTSKAGAANSDAADVKQSKVAPRGEASSKETEPGAGLVLSAWELREALDPQKAYDEDAVQWMEIHSQTHPDVQEFLKKRQQKRLAESRNSQPAAAQWGSKRNVPPAEDAIEEAEVVTIDDGEDDIGTASTKRRKVEASKRTGDVGRRGQGGNANSNKPGSVAGDSDTEEEDEEPLTKKGGKRNNDDQVNDGAKAQARVINAKDQAMIDELNNKRQQLLSVGDDPLAAAMAEAHGAKGRGRSIRMDSDDNGRSLHFDESIDDEDNAGPVLQLAAADTFFKPRRDILAHLSGNSALPNVGRQPSGKSGPAGKHRRWTPQEENALRDGVKEHGEGFWKKIQEGSNVLKDRSAVDCKDKWRNLQKKVEAGDP